MYARFTCETGFLRRHEERFFPFVDTGLDIDMAGYCRREVEPMGRECEQLHIIALTEYLGLRVAIEYLDGR
jgi:ubiquitin thioesterase protein OTUB1